MTRSMTSLTRFIRGIVWLGGAFAAGWVVGAVVMVSVASWRMLRDMGAA